MADDLWRVGVGTDWGGVLEVNDTRVKLRGGDKRNGRTCIKILPFRSSRRDVRQNL